MLAHWHTVSVRTDDLSEYLNQQTQFYQGNFRLHSVVFETLQTVLVVFTVEMSELEKTQFWMAKEVPAPTGAMALPTPKMKRSKK